MLAYSNYRARKKCESHLRYLFTISAILRKNNIFWSIGEKTNTSFAFLMRKTDFLPFFLRGKTPNLFAFLKKKLFLKKYQKNPFL